MARSNQRQQYELEKLQNINRTVIGLSHSSDFFRQPSDYHHLDYLVCVYNSMEEFLTQLIRLRIP